MDPAIPDPIIDCDVYNDIEAFIRPIQILNNKFFFGDFHVLGVGKIC